MSPEVEPSDNAPTVLSNPQLATPARSIEHKRKVTSTLETRQPLLQPVFAKQFVGVNPDDEIKNPRSTSVLKSSFRYVARDASNDRRNTCVGMAIIAISVCLSAFCFMFL